MILAAGLTPAYQQVLVLDSLTPGEVNRARQVHWCASGKVLNVARGLHHLGGPVRALTVVGGSPGEEIRRDFDRLGIPARWVEASTPTRVCTTLLDTARHSATELVPNAPELAAEERNAFLSAYAEEVGKATVVVLIGSLPEGTPPGLYRDLLARTPARSVLDARGPELLEALHAKPFLVKPNRQELGQTLGRELRSDADLFDAMGELNRGGARWVVITDGSRPLHARCGSALYRVQPPFRQVVNPIGCGDCLAAGIACALWQGREPLEAIRLGVAAAADKVGQFLPGVLDRGRVEALAQSLEVIPL